MKTKHKSWCNSIFKSNGGVKWGARLIYTMIGPVGGEMLVDERWIQGIHSSIFVGEHVPRDFLMGDRGVGVWK